MKLAVIGSADFCQQAQRLVTGRQDVTLDCYTYRQPQETAHMLQHIKPCDAILFSGSLPYAYAQEKITTLTVPVLYLQQDETTVATTLLYLLLHEQIDLSTISLDIRDSSHVTHVLNDLHHVVTIPHLHILQEDEEIDQIVDFHRQLWMQQQTTIAVTSVHAVYEQLSQEGIRTMKMIDPEGTLLKSIEQAKQQVMLHKSYASQVAVGLIRPHQEVNGERLETAVEQFTQLLQGQWSLQKDDYYLYTTLGHLKHLIEEPAFLSLFEQLTVDASVGFGAGESIMIATEHAQQALQLNSNSSHFYLLDSLKRLHGPLPNKHRIVNLQVKHPFLKEIAAVTKLSPVNISKVIQFSRTRQTRPFTANDLARYLNVSRRTAERVIKKLLESNYAQIVGEEMTYKQGRPRSLYQLNFSINLINDR